MVKLPQTMGGDMAGVVEEAGEGSRFKPGDRVFGMTDGVLPGCAWVRVCMGDLRGLSADLLRARCIGPRLAAPHARAPAAAPLRPQGTYAEYASVNPKHLALMPDGMSFETAAGLPCVALAAWESLDATKLKAGQRVLIHAGAGGVGSIALQLAKARGLYVITTCSTRNVDYCKQASGSQLGWKV